MRHEELRSDLRGGCAVMRRDLRAELLAVALMGLVALLGWAWDSACEIAVGVDVAPSTGAPCPRGAGLCAPRGLPVKPVARPTRQGSPTWWRE